MSCNNEIPVPESLKCSEGKNRDYVYEIDSENKMLMKDGEPFGEIMKVEHRTKFIVKRVSENRYLNGSVQVIEFIQ